MKILVVVHVEPDFLFSAPNLEDLAKKIVKYSRKFDHVINITSAEVLTGTKPFPIIAEHFSDNREWIWGFDAEYYEKEEDFTGVKGINYIETSGHEYSEILDWMQELNKSDKYTLVGGGRNECLQDIIDIFSHIGYDFKVKEKYTY